MIKINAQQKKQYFRLIGLILFGYILSKINLAELFSSFKNINLFYFVLGLIVLLVSPIFGVFKWRLLVESQNVKLPLAALLVSYWKGIFWGTATPARLGEFLRVKYLTSFSFLSEGRAFYTVFWDRLIDIIILVVVGLTGVVHFFWLNKIANSQPLIIMLLAAIVLIVYFLIRQEDIKKILKFFLKIFNHSSIKGKINYWLEEFFAGGQEKKLNLAVYLKLFFFGFLYYLCSVLAAYCFALSLNLSLTFGNLFLIIAINLLLLVLPITVLGLGTREAGFIFLFRIFNLPATAAVAFAELNLVGSLVLAIPGFVLFLKDKK